MNRNSDDEQAVCVTHLRFAPCRKCDNNSGWSTDPDDIRRVANYIEMRSRIL